MQRWGRIPVEEVKAGQSRLVSFNMEGSMRAVAKYEGRDAKHVHRRSDGVLVASRHKGFWLARRGATCDEARLVTDTSGFLTADELARLLGRSA